MKIESKKKRIDSDSGFLVLRPQEYAKLGTGLNESQEDDFLSAYERLKGDLESRRKHIVNTLVRMNKLEDDEVLLTGIMLEFTEHMGKAVGSMFGRDNLEFVDCGSFKMCAVFKCGCALKIGIQDKGLAGEIANSLDFPDLTCFPRLLGYDGAGKGSCVVEAVNPRFGDPECEKFYGVPRYKVVALLSGEQPENDADGKFLSNLRDAKGPEWDSMRDLDTFFRKYRPLYDISYNNWGLAKRNGHDVPVVLDYDL